jgi:hypothetical protein
VVSRPGGAFTAFSALVDDPADVDDLLEIEALTNPLARDAIGILATIPHSRRYAGPLASLIMTPCVLPGESRFSAGNYGVLYVANHIDVALNEVGHHHKARLLATKAAAGTTVPLYSLTVHVDVVVDDVRTASGGDASLYYPDDYSAGHAYGAKSRDAGNAAVHYDSVRYPGGECVGLFWPDGVKTASTGDEYRAYFDGAVITEYLRVT